jgi:sugar/nucleoside kinase (ribokinase family)
VTDTYDLVVVGDANPDVVLTGAPDRLAFGQVEHLVTAGTLTLGGSGAIMAHAAARLGLRTALVSVVGADASGRLVLDWLTAGGVDTRWISRHADLATALTVVLTKADGDRAILTAPAALAAFDGASVPADALAYARHVHVSALGLLPGLRPDVPALLAAARGGGASTSVDTNDDPAGSFALDLGALLRASDRLLPNEREAVAMAAALGHDAVDAVTAARALALSGPSPVVKCGAAGAVAWVDGVALRAVPPAAEPFVDAVGAGDCFDAGLVAGLLDGRPLPDAMRLAVACGTLSTRAAGGVDGQPTLAAAEAFATRVRLESAESPAPSGSRPVEEP